MDSLTVTYIILIVAGLIGFGSFAVLIFAPAWTAYVPTWVFLGGYLAAWTAYGRTWVGFAAAFLSMFVLAAFAGTGVGIGLVVLYYWDQILDLLGIQAALLPFV